MSRFYRRMEALSKKPSDFKRSLPGENSQSDPQGSTPIGVAHPEGPRPAGAGTATGVSSRGRTKQITPAPAVIPDAQRYVKSNARKLRVREIREVQDALTTAGQLLYLAMYGSYRDEGASKLCRKGYRELADLAHIDKDTVRVLLGEFKEKGIVREVGAYDSAANLGKTYEVLSYSAIKELWRRSGIEHVTVDRRPILCDASGKTKLLPTGCETHRAEDPQPQNRRGTVGLKHTGPVGSGPTPLDKEIKEDPTTTLRRLLQSQLPGFDDDAIAALWRDCRGQVPDVSPEEIAALFAIKLPSSRARGIDSQNGFLIRAVARSCVPALIDSWRQGREVALAEVSDESFRRVLEDPNSAEAEKLLARAAMGLGD